MDRSPTLAGHGPLGVAKPPPKAHDCQERWPATPNLRPLGDGFGHYLTSIYI
jgi:hypothetical protein